MQEVTRKFLKETWTGLDMNHKTCLKVLKRDKVFNDYFNAFLSLPAFSRPLYFDNNSEALLEIYKECNVPIVGVTIEIPFPKDDVKKILEQWLIKSRLPLFLTTSLYMEYLLCKELLKVCGAIQNRDDSEEELTESEPEDEEEQLPAAKDRDILDLAGLDPSSQMSTREGLRSPLIPTPPHSVHSDREVNETYDRDSPRDSRTDLIDMSRSAYTPSTTILSASNMLAKSEVDISVQSSNVSLTEDKSDTTEDPQTDQTSEKLPTPTAAKEEPPETIQSQSITEEPQDNKTSNLNLNEKLVPREVTKSVADMIPDSQSDINKPQIWQEIYKNRCSPLARVNTYPFMEDAGQKSRALTKQDKVVLIGSVTAMDRFRTFLSRTAGEHLLNLWLDISSIQRMAQNGSPIEDLAEEVRDLKDKYKNKLSSPVKLSLTYKDITSLSKLKAKVLEKLQFYWLPRYFYEKIKTRKSDGPLKLEPDEEVLKLPFLPSALVHRSYPSDINNLTTNIRHLQNWTDIFKEQDRRIVSGRLRTLSASIIRNNRDGFIYGVRSDRNAGGPFKRWLQDYDTTLVNILEFIEEVNKYQVHEERKADRGILKRMGWRMWHRYMAPGKTFPMRTFPMRNMHISCRRIDNDVTTSTASSGAVQSLDLGPSVTSDVRIALLTTKDYVSHTVFNTAKGNVMIFLKQAWKLYIQDDYEDYLQYRPDIMEQVRLMTETKIQQMQINKNQMQRRHFNRARYRRGKKRRIPTIFDSASEGELEEEDFAHVAIPTLEESLGNRVAMDKFNSWATRTLAGDKVQVYSLWNDIKSYLEINKQSNKQLRVMQAEHIFRTYFVNKDRKHLGLPAELTSKMAKERPNTPMLNRALTILNSTVEKVFDEFVQSLPLAQATLRRRSTTDDLVSNLSQQSFVVGGGRKRGKGSKNKKVPGRATPTKELYNRLLALLTGVQGIWPEELLLFEKYLGRHGADDGYPLIVNDLHFWVEVQRFKDMQHDNSDPAFILKKLEAIVDCYLDPQSPADPPPEKPARQVQLLSPPPSPTLSVGSKGPSSSAPESPSQSKVDLNVNPTEKSKKVPWNQRRQVDLSIDVGQKFITRLATPGGYLDKDLSIYDDAQKILLKELVPFYAGFHNQENNLNSSLSECKLCDDMFTPRKPYPCSRVNKKWVGTPGSIAEDTYELPSIYNSVKPKHYNTHTNKDHFTFSLEHGITWAKHIDEDMISANSEDALIPMPTRQNTKVKTK